MIESTELYEKMHRFNGSYQTTNKGLQCLDMWIDKLEPVVRSGPVRIIEVGCGNGLLCHELALRGFEVTGIDLVAGHYDRSGYDFRPMDALTMLDNFGDGSFDACLSFDVLEHLDEDDGVSVLKQMIRVAPRVITSIACSGGPPLHLTVRTPGWWLDKLLAACPDVDWRVLRCFDRYADWDSKVALFYGEKK